MTETEKKLNIERVYAKQVSMECYGMPEILGKEWKPETGFEMRMSQKRLQESDRYEVSILLEIKVKLADQLIGIMKVEQAGNCLVQGFTEEEQKYLFNAMIPAQLYPHATHKIYELFLFAGLPAIVLPPINFEAVYLQQQEKEKDKKGDKKSQGTQKTILEGDVITSKKH